jgi:teichuronic acid exporter
MPDRNSFRSAIKWAYFLYWGGKGLSALWFFVLAGLLGPRDFGIASLATIYVAFLQLFLDQGLATALIQRKVLQEEHLNAVFWMDLILSVVLVLVSLVFSRLWAAVNHTPELALITAVLSFSIIIEALSVVPAANLRRQMNFRSLSIRTNTAILLGGAVGVLMAYMGFGVWSLVGQQLIRDLVQLIMLWKLSPWRPSWNFSWPHFNELFKFSTRTFMAQLAIFAEIQSSSVILGLMFGPVAVGLYKVADRATSTVIGMATSSIQNISLPEFSRLQDDKNELRRTVLTCIRFSATVSLPALAALAALSDPLMSTIGATWVPAADALKVLCAAAMISIFSYFTGPLLQALGRPHELAWLEWGRTLLVIAILTVVSAFARSASVQAQVLAIAGARLGLNALVVTPIFVFVLLKLAGISLREFAVAASPSVLASMVVLIVIVLIRVSGLVADQAPMVEVVIAASVAGLAGLTVLLWVDPKFRGLVIESLPVRFRRLRPRGI